MTLKVTTATLVAGVAGGLAAYFNSPDIAMAGEAIRFGAAAGVGLVSAAGTYLGMKLSVELFGGVGVLPFTLAVASCIGGGYGGYRVGEAVAGNIVEEQASSQQLDKETGVFPVSENLVAYIPG